MKIGDRVKTLSPLSLCGGLPVGSVGVIVVIDKSSGMVGVRFSQWNERLHDLEGACKAGHGWYLFDYNLKVIDVDLENK